MSPRPIIFISAVSSELREQRELVAEILRFLGCDPIIQDEFETGTGNIGKMLSEKLEPCHGLIQLVGHAHGSLVKDARLVSDQISYTHFEADYAEKHDKFVCYILLADTWRPALLAAGGTPLGPEDGDLAEDQRTYRRKIKRSPNLYHTAADEKDLQIAIYRLLPKLEPFRTQPTPWLNAHAVPAPTGHQAAAQALDLKVQFREVFDEYVEKLSPIRQQTTPEAEEAGEDALIAQLAAKRKQTPDDLRRLLNQTAVAIQQDPGEPPMERAKAAFARREYEEAERLAVQAATEAAKAGPQRKADAIEAWILAGDCSLERIQYSEALLHFQSAAALTSQKDDVLPWARAQGKIGWVQYLQGAYREAEALMEAVWAECKRAGREVEPIALGVWHRWASLLRVNAKPAQAVAQYRLLIPIRERVLGLEHPNTLWSRMNLANALHSQGEYEEAEKECRAVLAIQERVMGAEHPDTLRSRMGLANALCYQRKHQEAEKDYRAVLAFQRRVLGFEHPDTLMSWMNLAGTLGYQGMSKEAEKEYRAVLTIQTRVLGPEHPDVFLTCHNLAGALWRRGKKSEALAFAKRAEEGRQKVLGPEHIDTKNAEQRRKRYEAGQNGR